MGPRREPFYMPALWSGLNLCFNTHSYRVWLYAEDVFIFCWSSGPSFSFDDRFNLTSLFKLEAAGIPILSALEKEHTLPETAGITMKFKPKDFGQHACGMIRWLERTVDIWEQGRATCPPTWRSLCEVLQELNLEVLSQNMVESLHGGKCAEHGWKFNWYRKSA